MQNWNELDKQEVLFDPLLDALVLMTDLYNRPKTRDSLIAGLPVEDQTLDIENFTVAAERGGLSAKLLKRSIRSLSKLTLPTLLLLKEKQTAILLDIDEENNSAKIMQPESGKSEIEIPLEELEELYSGYLYLIKPLHKFDGRTEQMLSSKEGHWFFSTMAESYKIYRDVLLASVIINLIVLAAPLYTRNVYDRVIPNSALDTLWTFTIGVFIAYTFDFILRMVRAYFLDVAGKKSDVLLSAKIFKYIQSTELSQRPKSTGTFAKQLGDFDSIRELITSSSVALIIDLPFTILFLVVIYIMAGSLVIVPIVAMVLILAFGLYAHSSMKYTVEKTYRASGEKSGLLYEGLGSIESVKAYNMQSRNQKKWEDATGEIAGWSIKTKLLSTAVGSWSNYIQQLATVASVVYGVYLIKDGHLSMGGLIAVSMLLGRTIAPMRQVASLITRIHGAQAAFESLDKIMQNDLEQDENKTYIQRDKLEGSFEFKDVDFAYPEAEVLSLHKMNFTIKPNQKLAILGRIGSGKSTIGKLLMRFYLPSEGSIYVDGIDINQLSPNELRKHIGYVPQNVQLFYGSIKDNIKIGVEHVDDKRVEMVARLAGVTDFTDKHPQGLDMQVGEMGQNLSGGQRQLVALARALILFPKILIMDEPSSSMDLTTEKILRDRLREIVVDKTLIIATHKASLLDLVDTLMVVEAGQLVAYGDKESVTAQLNSSAGGAS
jgi:ATP-binding cassette subfamily C protein LapB